MKGKAKAGYVLARIFEVIMWIGAAAMALSFLLGIAAPGAVAEAVDAGAAERKLTMVMTPGALGRMDITGPDGTLRLGLYLLYTAAGAAELALTASVFRRIWQIIRMSWGSTPFQRPVVKKVRQIGWLFIAAPLVTVAVSLAGFVSFWPEYSFVVDVSGIITGVIVLALSQIFAYGVKLEDDVEGLL